MYTVEDKTNELINKMDNISKEFTRYYRDTEDNTKSVYHNSNDPIKAGIYTKSLKDSLEHVQAYATALYGVCSEIEEWSTLVPSIDHMCQKCKGRGSGFEFTGIPDEYVTVPCKQCKGKGYFLKSA